MCPCKKTETVPNAPDGRAALASWHTGAASRVRRTPAAGWLCRQRVDVRCALELGRSHRPLWRWCAVGQYVVPVRVGWWLWALGVGLVLCLTVTGCVTIPQTPASEPRAGAMPEEKSLVAFTAVSAGHEHTCGVRTDGALACWGRNNSGQATPPEGTFATVSAGTLHTCGVRTDGTLDCWGWNRYGQVAPPGDIFATVSVGDGYTCGVRTDGTLDCWGWNTFGEATPPGGTFATVSAEISHTCGVRTDGTLVCWGSVVVG